MMNLHMLFSLDRSVANNMRKLLQAGDVIILLDEARSLSPDNVLNGRTDIQLFNRELPSGPKVYEPSQSLSDQQWLTLCNQAKLIHSWY